MLKRIFDVVAAGGGLLVLAPLFVVLALVVKLDSPGPVFFRQVRVGLGGRDFRLLKFRSMRVDAKSRGPQITVGRDPRVTRSGHFLRHWKFDELPQLINVVLGDMSLVGPRPEVPRYVAMYPTAEKSTILSVRPGITDPASVKFRNESEVLAASADPEKTYVEEILPEKLRLGCDYARSRSFFGDLRVIFQTFFAIIT